MPRDFTIADLNVLSQREQSKASVHCEDGKYVVHTKTRAWLWDHEAAEWVVSLQMWGWTKVGDKP